MKAELGPRHHESQLSHWPGCVTWRQQLIPLSLNLLCCKMRGGAQRWRHIPRLSWGLDGAAPTSGAVNSQPSPGLAVITDWGQEESATSRAVQLVYSAGWVSLSQVWNTVKADTPSHFVTWGWQTELSSELCHFLKGDYNSIPIRKLGVMLQMCDRKGLPPKKFNSWEIMFSALAFSWEVNQLKVNRLVTTPVVAQKGSGLTSGTAPQPTFLTSPQVALLSAPQSGRKLPGEGSNQQF